MRMYKPSTSYMSISKSLPIVFDSSHLEHFLKHIFEMGVNRKFDLGGTESFAGSKSGGTL